MKSHPAFVAFVLLLACSTPSTPPAGAQLAPAVPVAPPPAELSTIVVPIRASLAPLSAELETRVPKTFSDKRQERGLDIRYEVARDPIRLQMIGAGLHATTTARYALEACRGRFPCVSCGFGEARREAEITLHSKLEWDASWRMRSTTRALPLDFPRRCEPFGVDVTDRLIAPAVRDQLNQIVQTIDRNTPSMTNLRGEATRIWSSLQTPSAIADRTWLVLEPSEVALAPISGSGMNVTSTLTLRARTRVVVGERPAVTLKPLPPLSTKALAGTGMRVPLDVELSYDDASRLAAAELVGKTFENVKVEAVRVLPSKGGRLLIEADIDYRAGALKRYRGPVFLEGTPRYDAATSSVIVPDLEFAIDRARGNAFVRIAERLAHDTLRARLRDRARFSIGPRLTALRGDVGHALNRTLAPGVQLRGRVDTIQPVSVTALPNVVSIRVLATGAAEVELK
ncbi:MAG TPA: DUF4403 family protein [Thermoanaerobaculia bacterium]|jgi:hypothetical protein